MDLRDAGAQWHKMHNEWESLRHAASQASFDLGQAWLQYADGKGPRPKAETINEVQRLTLAAEEMQFEIAELLREVFAQ